MAIQCNKTWCHCWSADLLWRLHRIDIFITVILHH